MCSRPAVSTSRTSRPLLTAFAPRRPRQIERLVLLRRALVDRQPDVAGDDAQLFAGGGTVDVHRDHHRAVAVLRQPAGQLAGRGGLTGSLQADDQEDAGRLVGEAQLDSWLPRILISSSWTILMTCCDGREGAETSSPMAFDLNVFDELLDDFEIDVGFEQRHADFAQGRLHVLGRELAFAAQILENPLQLFR